MDKNKIAFILCLALGIIGVQLYSSTPSVKPDLVINRSTNIPTSKPPSKVTAKIKVQISGAVAIPGIYELNKGSRTEDLVQLAGGLSADADRDKANLAKNLKDGMLISIPYKKQSRTATTSPNSNKINSTTNNNSSVININTADAQSLQTLKGIGPVLAERIVSYRQEHGRFNSKQDLLKVPGIGSKLLDKISEQLSLD